MGPSVTRSQVLSFLVRAQQLDRESGLLADTAALDLGVQDTGPDGARWALANRGVDVSGLSADMLVGAWTIRGAPHLYLREDLLSVATVSAGSARLSEGWCGPPHPAPARLADECSSTPTPRCGFLRQTRGRPPTTRTAG